MLFNSIEFLIFLPIVFLLYRACRTVLSQNLLIVAASYLFYGWWDVRFLALIALTSFCSYASGLTIEHYDGKRHLRGAVCILNVVLNLAVLATFKYFNFFAESFIGLLQNFGLTVGWTSLNIVLPVGISFYTFQALSYTIDVYRRDMRAEHDAVAFFAFISFFPQLVAGPIERATNLLPQFKRLRNFSYNDAIDGLRQALWGFFKKIVIADRCAVAVDIIFSDYTDCSSAALLYGAVLFTFQIYADFSGYSDIAIGIARLFGVRLVRNFNNPYLAVDMGDFWRRWHMSLMSWFRDYVYIPLGGSRCGKWHTARNIFAVFLLSGLWHGANWTFVAWGAYHALLRMPSVLMGKRSKSGTDDIPPTQRLLCRLSVFVLVMAGWILFRSATIADAWHYITCLLSNGGFYFAAGIFKPSLCIFIAAMMLVEYATRHRDHALQISGDCGIARWRAVRWCIYYVLIAAIFWQAGSATQFIYFQF